MSSIGLLSSVFDVLSNSFESDHSVVDATHMLAVWPNTKRRTTATRLLTCTATISSRPLSTVQGLKWMLLTGEADWDHYREGESDLPVRRR